MFSSYRKFLLSASDNYLWYPFENKYLPLTIRIFLSIVGPPAKVIGKRLEC